MKLDNIFVNIHNHTEYSGLDGMCKIIEIVARAKELGQTALAITDHGNCDGIYQFQEECKKQGIKPILGEEFYYLNGYDDMGKPIRGHLIVLAKNNKGLENMFKLQEKAYGDNFYRKPIITFEDLKMHSEGLIVASACLANRLPKLLLAGEYMEARREATKFKELFGDDYYIEIQGNSLMEQYNVNRELESLAKELKIKMIVTNDTHYVYKEDADVHEVLLAMGTKKKMDDPKRWKFPSKDFWLKSQDEMIESTRGVSEETLIQCIYNTKEIADKCNAEILPGHFNPKYPFLEEGTNATTQLRNNAKKGLADKGLINDARYVAMVEQEIDCIARNDYSDYFLIVQDYIKRAREAGVLVGDGRGSGAGSKICYALDITRVEPQEYDLLFERFMADGREPD